MQTAAELCGHWGFCRCCRAPPVPCACEEGAQAGAGWHLGASPWLPGPGRESTRTLLCPRLGFIQTQLRLKGWCPHGTKTTAQSTGALPALLSRRKVRVELCVCAVSIQQVSGHGGDCAGGRAGTVVVLIGRSGVMLLERFWLCLCEGGGFSEEKNNLLCSVQLPKPQFWS